MGCLVKNIGKNLTFVIEKWLIIQQGFLWLNIIERKNSGISREKSHIRNQAIDEQKYYFTSLMYS